MQETPPAMADGLPALMRDWPDEQKYRVMGRRYARIAAECAEHARVNRTKAEECLRRAEALRQEREQQQVAPIDSR